MRPQPTSAWLGYLQPKGHVRRCAPERLGQFAPSTVLEAALRSPGRFLKSAAVTGLSATASGGLSNLRGLPARRKDRMGTTCPQSATHRHVRGCEQPPGAKPDPSDDRPSAASVTDPVFGRRVVVPDSTFHKIAHNHWDLTRLTRHEVLEAVANTRIHRPGHAPNRHVFYRRGVGPSRWLCVVVQYDRHPVRLSPHSRCDDFRRRPGDDRYLRRHRFRRHQVRP